MANKDFLILAPRGHGKSVLLSMYVIWRIINNPNIRILVVSSTGAQSTLFMNLVQGWFESDTFKNLFGDYTTTKKWNSTEIIVKGRTQQMRDSTLAVSSFGGNITSRHVDLLIVDDIADEENSRTKTQRDILETWYFKTLTPILEPEARTVILGTRWHYEDIYGTFIGQGIKHILMGTPAKPTYDDMGILNGGIPLWEERWNIDRLRERYQKMGSIFFNSQYFNDPSGMKGQIFEYDWFQWYEESEVPTFDRIYIGVDPASKQTEYADYFAMVVIGITKTGDIYILDAYQGHIAVQSQIDMIQQYFLRYKPISVAIEVNAYQRVLAQHMESLMVRVQEITTSVDKVTRAFKIQPYLQNRKLYVKKSMKETLVRQMIQFPNTDRKDLLDALGFAIEASIGGTFFINTQMDTKDRTRLSAAEHFFEIGERAK